jgi:hypothetical protein
MTTGQTSRIIGRRVASVVAALCAFAGTTTITASPQRFVVAIRLYVDRTIANTRVTDRVKTETDAIWSMYGIEFAWSDADATPPAASILLLDVRIEREPEPRGPTEWPTILGHVVMKPPHSAWRPIHVSLNATERVLADRPSDRPSSRIVLDRELARALGRVLAHEIGHVLLDIPNHDRAGLMRARFRGDILADPDRRPFRLACSGVDRLGRRLRELTGNLHAAVPLGSTDSDADGVAAASETSGGSSCISIRPTR